MIRILISDKIAFILTHWGRVTHRCAGNLTIIGSDNGLSPGRRQAIICTNAGLLLIGTLGTNFSEILIEIHIFLFKKMRLKVSSPKWRPFCFGLNVLRHPSCYPILIIPAPRGVPWSIAWLSGNTKHNTHWDFKAQFHWAMFNLF